MSINEAIVTLKLEEDLHNLWMGEPVIIMDDRPIIGPFIVQGDNEIIHSETFGMGQDCVSEHGDGHDTFSAYSFQICTSEVPCQA